MHPEEFVEVEVAAAPLGGAVVGAEEVQLSAVGQHDRVARQLPAQRLLNERLHVVLELVRLRLARRKEDLIAPRQQRIDQRLAGEVEGRADLA